MLKPEIKITDNQEQIIKTDWPRSGWSISSDTINNKSMNEKKYANFSPFIQKKQIICTTDNIKKGFINSIGWNLNTKKSNHLFAPFTSTPIKGTRNKANKKIRKIGNRVMFRNFVFNNDIEIIIKNEMNA